MQAYELPCPDQKKGIELGLYEKTSEEQILEAMV